MAKKVEKANNPYTLNSVEGFDPYEFKETSYDAATGTQIISTKTGQPLQHLNLNAKTLWFYKVCPDGIIKVNQPIGEDNKPCGIAKIDNDLYTVTYIAYVKKHPDADMYERDCVLVTDAAGIPNACTRAANKALGRVLSLAGFGVEVELALNSEDEAEIPSRSQAPLPKKGEKKAAKAEIEKTEPMPPEEEIKTEDIDLLALIEADDEEVEQDTAEETPDLMETVIKVKDGAKAAHAEFAGLTFAEAKAKNGKIIKMIAENPRVQTSFDDETVATAKAILKQ